VGLTKIGDRENCAEGIAAHRLPIIVEVMIDGCMSA
jgi:hypothetical protein